MKRRILIIDDTKNIRLLITKALSPEGYEVDSADNGQVGIELFRENKYDLVLLDIRMPIMSGTEVLRIIKEIDKSVPVIIITAYATVKNAVDCVKLGAIDYLRKPFTAEKIKEIINQVLQRKQLTDADTGSYEAAVEFAKKCINERNFDEGVKYLKKAISIDIDRAEPFNIMGNVFELQGDLANALKYYSIANQLEPGDEGIIENLNRVK